MKTECIACHGKVTQKSITHTQWINDQIILVENVPAWVCEQCGETYFDPDIVEQIQNLIGSDAPPARHIKAPVYDLSATTPT